MSGYKRRYYQTRSNVLAKRPYAIDRGRFPRAYARPAAAILRRQIIPRPWRFGGFRNPGQRAPQERKLIDVAQANYALDTTGSVTLLNTVAQGAGVNQRVGKKIVMKGLQCRGNMANNSNATFNDVAFMIVYDKRPTGALPAITDILVSASSNALNNDTNGGRFRIIKRVDDVLTGNFAAAQNVTTTSAVPSDWWLDLKSAPVVYKAAGTGAIGDIEEGALYLVTVGNTAAGTTAATAAMAFRLRFLDV